MWNCFHHPDDVEVAFRKSLDALGLDYLDLYLIHWPYGFQRGTDMFPKNEDGSLIVSCQDQKIHLKIYIYISFQSSMTGLCHWLTSGEHLSSWLRKGLSSQLEFPTSMLVSFKTSLTMERYIIVKWLHHLFTIIIFINVPLIDSHL